MRKERHITSFYIETLLLIAVFIAIILVLTQVFGLGRVESGEARLLTNAVTLAQNTAEAFSASGDPQQLASLLDENGNTSVTGDTVKARYTTDMTPDPNGEFTVSAVWTPASAGNGALVSCVITVCFDNEEEPVYTLDTAVYLGEVPQ